VDRRHFLGLGLATVGAALLPRTGLSAPAHEGAWTHLALEPRWTFTVGAVGSRALVIGRQRWDKGAYKFFTSDRVDIYDATTGAWSSAKLAQPRMRARTAAVGSRLLIVGWHSVEGIVESVEIYDSESDSWSFRPLPLGRGVFSLSTVGDQVLIRANLPDDGSVLHTYAAASDTWTSQQSPAPMRGRFTVVAGSTVLYGGASEDVWNEIDVYNTETGALSTISLPTPRKDLTATSIGPLALFAGGLQGSEGSDVVDIYDTTTSSWSTAHLSGPRYRPTACVIGERLMFVGATQLPPESVETSRVVDIFDVSSREWTTSRPTTRGTFQSAVVAGHYALFSSSSKLVDVYDAAADRWTTTELSVARSGYAVASVGRHVLFAGGSTTGTSLTLRPHLDVVDIYDTASGAWTTGQLQMAREAPQVAVVGSQVLFVGGSLACQGCGPNSVDPVVDIFDASLA